MSTQTKTKIAIALTSLAAIGGIAAYRAASGGTADGSGTPSASAAASAAKTAPAVEVTMLYGSEKKEWIDAAAESFRREHPEVKLTLVPKGSLEAAQGILDGRERPTIFSPADSLVMNMLAS